MTFWKKLCVLFISAVYLVFEIKACSETFTTKRGTLRSPSFPDLYPSDQNCTYVISRPEGERITLMFLVFDLEGGFHCPHDYVEIRDGDSENSPFMARLCGVTLPSPVRSFHNSLWLRFYSDGTLNGSGFLATYLAANPKDQFFLIASSAGRIYRVDLRTNSQIVLPIPDLFNPIAVDFDPLEGRIYWTEIGHKQILTSYLNGSHVTIVRQFDLETDAMPDGIAIDPLSRLLFYTDAGTNVIAMMTLSGASHRVIIDKGLDKPRSIVLHTEIGMMFWTDWGTPTKIERANYDGTDRRALHTKHLQTPNGLAIDVNGSRLYWVDAGTDVVESSDLEGKDRRLLYSAIGSHFFGLTYYRNELYLTDWGPDGSVTNVSFIHQLSTDGRGGTIIGRVFGRLNDIHLYSEDDWYKGPTGCSQNNGGCTHFCLPLPGNTFKCMCPDAPTECVEVSQDHASGVQSYHHAELAGVIVAVACFIIIVITCVVLWKRVKRTAVQLRPEATVTYNRLSEPDIHDHPYYQPVVMEDTEPNTGRTRWSFMINA